MTETLPELPKQRRAATLGESGYERKPREAYFTPPWVTRALLAAYPDEHFSSPIWEPACGDGRMAEVLYDTGACVFCSDIHDYGYKPTVILDFLRDPPPRDPTGGFYAVITNPPFDLAIEFVTRALAVVLPNRGKVAIVQRHEFDAPAKHHPLFRPPFPFAEKLVLHKRPRWSEDDKASPRFPFSWYIWNWQHRGPPTIRYLPDPDKPTAAALPW